jgi:indole-3-glycerol phosphate synthase
LQDVEQLAKAATPVRGFAKALQHKRPGVIAEIKSISIKRNDSQTLILLKLLSNMNKLVQHVCRY